MSRVMIVADIVLEFEGHPLGAGRRDEDWARSALTLCGCPSDQNLRED